MIIQKKNQKIKNILVAALVIILMLNQTALFTVHKASAAMKSGDAVEITKEGQVLDSITYLGKKVDAVYSPKNGLGSDPVYSCAAFVKKFYSDIYGITVYNLLSPSSTPLVNGSKEYFQITDSPQVGDIIRQNTRTHWGIVKSIDGNLITVIQQNYKHNSTAYINCTIDMNDNDFTYFTYTGRIEDPQYEEKLASDPVTVPEKDTDSLPSEPNTSDFSSIVDLIPVEPDTENPKVPQDETIQDGVYQVINIANNNYMHTENSSENCQVITKPFDDSSKQILDIVKHGKNQYSLRFLEGGKYLFPGDNNRIYSVENLLQYYVFTERTDGLYTISPAKDKNKVLAESTENSENGMKSLVLKSYTGAPNELWAFQLLTEATDKSGTPSGENNVQISSPQIINKKMTLYTGYKSGTSGLSDIAKHSYISYLSTEPDIVKVSKEGEITPVHKGIANIIATIVPENQVYIYTITVKDPYLKITDKADEISVGESYQFKAKQYGITGSVEWSVSDQTIVEINKKTGKLTGLKQGEVTVSVTCKGVKTIKTKVIIK